MERRPFRPVGVVLVGGCARGGAGRPRHAVPTTRRLKGERHAGGTVETPGSGPGQGTAVAGHGQASGAQITPAAPETRRRRYRSSRKGSRPERAVGTQMAGRAPDVNMARREARGARREARGARLILNPVGSIYVNALFGNAFSPRCLALEYYVAIVDGNKTPARDGMLSGDCAIAAEFHIF